MINDFLFTIILFWLLISISLEDIRTLLISNKNLIMLAMSGLLYSFINGYLNKEINTLDLLSNNLQVTIIIFTSMTSISLLSYKLLGVNSLGLGDIKLASFAVSWIGLEGVLSAISISLILSSIYFLYNKTIRKVKIFHQYPFAPFVSLGIFWTWIIAKI